MLRRDRRSSARLLRIVRSLASRLAFSIGNPATLDHSRSSRFGCVHCLGTARVRELSQKFRVKSCQSPDSFASKSLVDNSRVGRRSKQSFTLGLEGIARKRFRGSPRLNIEYKYIFANTQSQKCANRKLSTSLVCISSLIRKDPNEKREIPKGETRDSYFAHSLTSHLSPAQHCESIPAVRSASSQGSHHAREPVLTARAALPPGVT